MKQKIVSGGLPALNRELQSDEWHDAKYVILLDENTFQHCLPLLIEQVEVLQEAEFIEIPTGEDCKSLEVASQVWQTLMESEADRGTVIVNLGGGCVSDLGGYVASCFKRGLRCINIPTTLLSMVDAAIGGKTAVNFGGVKNSIGTFHEAEIVCIERSFLGTLPPDELLNGRFEMIKTAAVTDAELFEKLLANDTVTQKQISNVARIKHRVAVADPYDHDIRHILNFGHTFGHAIEVYRELPHGVAVGLGMIAAMYLSVRKTELYESVYQSYSMWVKPHLPFDFMPFNLKDIEQLLALMRHDKKNAEGAIRCVLLKELGAAMIDVEVSDNEIRDALLRLDISRTVPLEEKNVTRN